MCVAIPLKIEEINGNDAVGTRDGVRREIRLDFIRDPKLGEYVIVHAGFAIERIDETSALEAIALANEIENISLTEE
ncbi:MAG: HypC/HybG/HupF family hydrogenase formation chaperone [Parasporobacterium sp.]|nr:HypC/HybG/HupF family hydrogenase formation chaperone [Parasporobacterium sp.]